MLVLRRCRLLSACQLAVVVLLLVATCRILAFKPTTHRSSRQATTRIPLWGDNNNNNNNNNNEKPFFGARTRTRSTRSTQLALTESGEMDTAELWWNTSLNIGLEDGGIFGTTTTPLAFLFVAFAASVGAFVFANVVYTPEILEGAKDLRRTERESEISKILQVVRSHQADGKETNELRIPLETALGKSLEDYVKAVLLETEEEEDDEYSLYTSTDQELATVLKKSLHL